jgi:large subunit ribosomal protein L25
MAETLEVKLRDSLGTRNTRRMRRSGAVPVVLYGHGQPNVCLTVSAEQLEAALRHGSRLVHLTGAVTERAFLRDLQWDTYGLHPLHVDLTRVSEHEKVKVTVPVELRGEAPGVRAGGVINHLIHELDIECEVTAIPEKLYVSINQLKLGDSITIAQMGIPAGVVVEGDVEEIVVECVEPAAEVEEAAAEAVPGEPEVIGRKKEEEEAEE